MRVVSPSNLAADFSSALPRRRNSSPSSSAAKLTWPPAVELARLQGRRCVAELARLAMAVLACP
jgi:hypothetical protein